MLSRTIGAAVAALVVAGAATAQAPALPPVPGHEPVPYGDPVSDALFPIGGGGGVSDAGYWSSDRWWVTGEYLLGFTRSSPLPALVTTGTTTSLGIVGRPGTQVVFGGDQDFGGVSGGKFSGGYFLDACRAYAFEWGVFFLPTQRTQSTFGANSAEVVARPFFDNNLVTENARLVSLSNQFTGTVASEFSTLFWGAEAGMAVRVLETSTFSFDQLFHFRYYGLEESVSVSDSSSSLPGGGTLFFNGAALPPGATVRVSDYYSAINRWVGGAAGLRVNWSPGRWLVSVTGRLGVGAVQQKVTVDGETSVIGAGNLEPIRGGVLAVGNQVGRYSQVDLSFAPEVTLRVGYRLTDHIAVTAGYQYLYMTNVARPGQQILRTADPTQIPSGQNFGAAGGTGNPPFVIQSSDFWMHGLTAGLMFSF